MGRDFDIKSAVPPIFRTSLHSLGFSFRSDVEIHSLDLGPLAPTAGSLFSLQGNYLRILIAIFEEYNNVR